MTKVEAASQNRRKSRIAIWESGRGVYFLSGPSALLLVAVGEPDNILDDVLPDGVYIQVEGWRDWYILLSRCLPSRSPNPIITTRSRRLQFCDHVPNGRWFKCCLHLFLKLTKKTSNPFAKLSEISICALPRTCFLRIPSENLTYATFSLERKISQNPLASNRLRKAYWQILPSLFFYRTCEHLSLQERQEDWHRPFRTIGPLFEIVHLLDRASLNPKQKIYLVDLAITSRQHCSESPRFSSIHMRVVTEIPRYCDQVDVLYYLKFSWSDSWMFQSVPFNLKKVIGLSNRLESRCSSGRSRNLQLGAWSIHSLSTLIFLFDEIFTGTKGGTGIIIIKGHCK